MFTLGLILARAGSRGLPGKCLRPVCGRPLICYTFDHACSARRLDARVLSSDCHEALNLASQRGVETILRPAELATDTALVDAAARHAVEVWEQSHGGQVDAVVLLYGNIPIRAAGVIDRAIELLERSGADSVRTVAPIGRHHPDWLHRLEGDRMVQFRPNSVSRRQDLTPLFYHDGAVAAVTRRALFSATPGDGQSFLGQDRRALVQSAHDAVDVDDSFDLAVADGLLSRAWRESLAQPKVLKIGQREIGDGLPAYVIAEAGVNHNGQLDAALQLVQAAAKAGADAVKFQVFRARSLATAAARTATYQGHSNGNQRDMLRALELEDDALARLQAACREVNVEFLATPFSPDDVERLARLGVRAIKIASTDIDNVPLLRAAASLDVPLIISTGAAEQAEIAACVDWLRSQSLDVRTALLHCVSAYPTPPAHANLRAIRALRETFGLLAGYSDHTLSVDSGAWAVAAGARIIEKHLTLDTRAAGPDHPASLEPADLARYIERIRQAEIFLGSGQLGMSAVQADVRRVARRGLVAARDLAAGTRLDAEMLVAKRPAEGIAPLHVDQLVGRRLQRSLAADTPLTWDMVE